MDVVKVAMEMAQKHVAVLESIVGKLKEPATVPAAAAELQKEVAAFKSQMEMIKGFTKK